MKKFNKKEIEAIEGLICMLDELDNKPRRLYEALIKFAFVFYKDRDNLPTIVRNLERAKDEWYINHQLSQLCYDIPHTCKQQIDESIEKYYKSSIKHSEEYDKAFEDGVNTGAKSLAKELLEKLIETY